MRAYTIIIFLLIATSVNILFSQEMCMPGYYLCSTEPITHTSLNDHNIDLPTFVNNSYDFVTNETFYFIPKEDKGLELMVFPLLQIDDFDFLIQKADLDKEGCNWKPITFNFDGPDLTRKIKECELVTGVVSYQDLSCNNYNKSFENSLYLQKDQLYAITILNSTSKSGFHLEFVHDIALYEEIPQNEAGIRLLEISENIKNVNNPCSFVSTTSNYSTLSIYPNPFSESTFVESMNKSIQSISIMNEHGVQVMHLDKPTNRNTILDIGFPSGIYFILTTFKDGSKSVDKVVKI